MTKLITLLAETPIHVGIGQSNEAIDLPVARERSTHFPHVPGSGAKGALKVWAEGAGLTNMVGRMFGKASGDFGDDTGAGSLLCGEMRLALLPVRCVSGSYRYATCPLILQRLARDLARAQPSSAEFPVPRPARGRYCGNGNQFLELEEREFERDTTDITPITAKLAQLFTERFDTADEVADAIAILQNDDFAWFAQFGLPVVTRNELDERKTVRRGHLWTEEMLPSDTLMWMTVAQRTLGNGNGAVQDDLATLAAAISSHPYVQVGGNETVGQGWLYMSATEGTEVAK